MLSPKTATTFKPSAVILNQKHLIEDLHDFSEEESVDGGRGVMSPVLPKVLPEARPLQISSDEDSETGSLGEHSHVNQDICSAYSYKPM